MMKRKSLLQQGMIVILSITVIIGILLATTLYLSVITAQDTARDVVAKAHDAILERLTTSLTNIENASYILAYSPPIQTMLTDTATAYPFLEHHQEVRQTLTTAFASSDAITGISLYDAQAHYVLSAGTTNYNVPDDLPRQFIGCSSAVYAGAQYDDLRNSQLLLLVYPVYLDNQVEKVMRRHIGYLGITLDAALLRTLISQSEFVENTLIAFSDQNRKLIMGNQEMDASSYQSMWNAAGKNVFRSNVFHTGWTLHCIMSNSSISQNMLPIVLIICVVMLLLSFLIVWMQRFFVQQILHPLRDLQDFMVSAPQGHDRISLNKRPENEMRMVMGVLNNMLDIIDRSNEELVHSQTRVLQEESARQQMEIIAYRNQINPHFLYNTLDCIRGIAYMHNATEIVEISQGLSRMFRYAVKGGDFSTLRQELEYLQHYAVIIGHRFSGRIDIQPEVDESLQDCVVIKLLLQPLVENAVLHGLERVIGQGRVHVLAQETQGKLFIRISDNGQGVTKQKLQELQQQIADVRRMPSGIPAAQRGVGLMNIARRLYLHYGDDSVLRVEQENQKGLKVEIILPIKREAEACTESSLPMTKNGRSMD